MKKILALCLMCLVIQSVAEAKNYAKQHMKELKKSQKYSTSANYFTKEQSENLNNVSVEIKDPKLLKLGNYEEVSVAKYKEKLAKDELEYKKIKTFLAQRKVDNYNYQAYGEDFYRVYRIAERIIRANRLDFINWRIVIDVDDAFNAYSSYTNCITVHTGAIDTFADNEDALAMIIGHEIAHSMLGHCARKSELYSKIQRAERIGSYEAYILAMKKFYRESRKMELAADAEGAKFVARAGYNMESARNTISFMNTMGNSDDRFSTHPKPQIRLKNYDQNVKYFLLSELSKQGKYNLYSTKVLSCQKSSNRKSLTLVPNKQADETAYYTLENEENMYLAYGYKSYLNGDFKEAINYFKKYLKLNKGNYAVYLYLSYANECLYKQTGREGYLNNAREFANYAKTIQPKNKYVQEQILAL